MKHYLCLILLGFIATLAANHPLQPLVSTVTSITELEPVSLQSTQQLIDALATSPCENKHYLSLSTDAQKNHELKTSAVPQDIHCTFWTTNIHHALIETTDLLLIHPHYSYQDLRKTLEQFHCYVQQYICVPCPDSPWNIQDDDDYFWKTDICNSYPHKQQDRACGGMRLPIAAFLSFHPEWVVSSDIPHDCGWTVLKRVGPQHLRERYDDPEVEHTLQHNMILCTGPALNRASLLKQVTEADLALIPFKKIVVTGFDSSIAQIDFQGQRPIFQWMPKQENQYLDVAISTMTSLETIGKDPEIQDDDIVYAFTGV